jgi:hypothetical protein
MIKDANFKMLRHCCKEYEVYSSGTEIQKNYSPDFVLKSGNKYIIIEHETEPNRKTIVADVFKAAYFLQEEKEGILVIVMTPKKPSSFESYPKHVLSYYNWLKERTNLTDVIFVHESNYYDGKVVLVINDEVFVQNSTSLNSMMQR